MSFQPPVGSQFLIVDDDDRLRPRLAQALRDRGYVVREAEHADAVLRSMAHDPADHVVLDLRMPGRSGLEVLADLMERWPQLKVVVLTGYGSITTTVEAMRLGAVNFLAKPVGVQEVLEAFNVERSGSAEVDPPTLARAEWEHMQRVLNECDGNITRAAELLGLHRRTLQRKLQKNPPRK